MGKITIITCCYNCEAFFHKTRDSVIAQTYDNWEHICVDDASKDGTWEVLEAYQRQFPDKVKIFRNHYVDGRKPYPYQIGLAMCTGDYLQKLDHDDYLSPDCFEKAIQRFNETDADAIVPQLVHFQCEPSVSSKSDGSPGYFGDVNAVISGREAAMASLDWSIHGNAVWRMQIVRQVPYSTEREQAFDEFERLQRLRYMKCRTVAFSLGKFYYCQMPSSMVHKPWGRYNHLRLITNRDVLKALITERYPHPVIDAYRVQTYRLLCSSYARFVLSTVYRSASERRAVRRELRDFYKDPVIIDRPKVLELCPTFLDWLRLNFFWMIVPITFWRKFLNRISGQTRIF